MTYAERDEREFGSVGSLQEERTESGVEGRDGDWPEPEFIGEARAGMGGLAGLGSGNEEDGEVERVAPAPVEVEVPVRREDEVLGVGLYDPTGGWERDVEASIRR